MARTDKQNQVEMQKNLEIHYGSKHYFKDSRLYIYIADQHIFHTQISKFHPDLIRSDELTEVSSMTTHAAPHLIKGDRI